MKADQQSFPYLFSLLFFLTSMPYTKRMRAKITSKGQITIPARVRRKLRLEPGQVLEFDEDAPFLKAVKVFDPKAMYDTIGCCRETPETAESAEEWLEATRGAVELPGKRKRTTKKKKKTE